MPLTPELPRTDLPAMRSSALHEARTSPTPAHGCWRVAGGRTGAGISDRRPGGAGPASARHAGRSPPPAALNSGRSRVGEVSEHAIALARPRPFLPGPGAATRCVCACACACAWCACAPETSRLRRCATAAWVRVWCVRSPVGCALTQRGRAAWPCGRVRSPHAAVCVDAASACVRSVGARACGIVAGPRGRRVGVRTAVPSQGGVTGRTREGRAVRADPTADGPHARDAMRARRARTARGQAPPPAAQWSACVACVCPHGHGDTRTPPRQVGARPGQGKPPRRPRRCFLPTALGVRAGMERGVRSRRSARRRPCSGLPRLSPRAAPTRRRRS
jgi:hypothetical protein